METNSSLMETNPSLMETNSSLIETNPTPMETDSSPMEQLLLHQQWGNNASSGKQEIRSCASQGPKDPRTVRYRQASWMIYRQASWTFAGQSTSAERGDLLAFPPTLTEIVFHKRPSWPVGGLVMLVGSPLPRASTLLLRCLKMLLQSSPHVPLVRIRSGSPASASFSFCCQRRQKQHFPHQASLICIYDGPLRRVRETALRQELCNVHRSPQAIFQRRRHAILHAEIRDEPRKNRPRQRSTASDCARDSEFCTSPSPSKEACFIGRGNTPAPMLVSCPKWKYAELFPPLSS